jgi:hypothetical protein
MQMLAVQYAEAHARAEITNYVSQSVSYTRTPNFERVRQFCGAFNQAWREVLDNRVKEDQKAALNSIYNIRNTLAHGDDYPLSLGIMTDYYKRVLILLDVLEDIFAP